MPTKPLVSIIIPTRNSAATLEACLHSVQAQTYRHIELIIVDRKSSDRTTRIAKRFTPHVYNHGPERSAQRNLGAARATGAYLLFVDSDMELAPEVVAACVALGAKKSGLVAVNIPEISFGVGFWSKCKALERSYYIGVDWIEAPRFMTAAAFKQAGGYDTAIAGGEDWDLTARLRALGPVGRIAPAIRHNEGRITFTSLIKKRYYYASGFASYYAKGQPRRQYSDGLRMIGLFFTRPMRTLRHPLLWGGMMFMRAAEFAALAAGGHRASRRRPR